MSIPVTQKGSNNDKNNMLIGKGATVIAHIKKNINTVQPSATLFKNNISELNPLEE